MAAGGRGSRAERARGVRAPKTECRREKPVSHRSADSSVTPTGTHAPRTRGAARSRLKQCTRRLLGGVSLRCHRARLHFRRPRRDSPRMSRPFAAPAPVRRAAVPPRPSVAASRPRAPLPPPPRGASSWHPRAASSRFRHVAVMASPTTPVPSPRGGDERHGALPVRPERLPCRPRGLPPRRDRGDARGGGRAELGIVERTGDLRLGGASGDPLWRHRRPRTSAVLGWPSPTATRSDRCSHLTMPYYHALVGKGYRMDHLRSDQAGARAGLRVSAAAR